MTDPLQNCLSTDELREYALGRLPEPQCDVVASHIETCVACEETISSLDGTADSIVDYLRVPPPKRNRPQPEFEQAIQRLKDTPIVDGDADAAGQLVQTNILGSERPAEIRDYRLIEQLGAGGMGTVFKAVHTKLDRVVALKLLTTRRTNNADAIERFEREMKAIGKLDHAAIVRATDAGEDDGQHFLAMEFVDGFDVSELVDRYGPLSVADACEIIRQAAIGLQHVHEQQLVHRDIKPSNIMVTPDGQVKVLDLGLALLAEQLEGVEELTTVGQMMGTVDYMAPEQCDDSHDVDIRADIYGLGSTLFKMLTGRAPFATPERRTPMSRIRALATQQAPRLSECMDDIDPELCGLVSRLLPREPADRPATPGEVAELLNQFVTGHDLPKAVAVALVAPAPARKTGLFTQQAQRSVQPESQQSPSTHASKTGRGWRVAKYLLPLVALAAAAIVFRLQTDKGELIFECNVPNAEIQLLKDGKIHEELSLKQGKTSVSVFSGQYEIRIPGQTDSIEVSTDKFRISRGSSLVAEVRYVKTAEPNQVVDSAAENVGDTAIPELTYEGKTFSDWRLQLADREPRQQTAAMEAIGILGVDVNAELAGRMIFDSVKRLFRHSDDMSHGFSSQISPNQIRHAAVDAFRPLLDDPRGVDVLRNYLTDGDTASRRFAICVLGFSDRDKAVERAIPSLLPALLAASHDDDVDVRVKAIYQTQGHEADEPLIAKRYVEMLASEDYDEASSAADILFNLVPEKQLSIGQRFLQFYEANKENFQLDREAGKSRSLIGDISLTPTSLLHVAIEGGVKTDSVPQELLTILQETKAHIELRVQAAYLLGLYTRHEDGVDTGLVVDALVKLLEDQDSLLNEACTVNLYELRQSEARTAKYPSGLAFVFDELRQYGPAAKKALPQLNSFLADIEGHLGVSARLDGVVAALKALPQIGINSDSLDLLETYTGMTTWQTGKGEVLSEVAKAALTRVSPEELKRLQAEQAKR